MTCPYLGANNMRRAAALRTDWVLSTSEQGSPTSVALPSGPVGTERSDQQCTNWFGDGMTDASDLTKLLLFYFYFMCILVRNQ